MPFLHDAAFKNPIETRLNGLRADSPRQWGTMSPDQMLWHVNAFLASALGEGTLPAQKSPMPLPILKFFLLYIPWPKSAPTNVGAVPGTTRHDFEAERTRCRALIQKFTSPPIEGAWPVDPTFGPVSGKFASRLQARHLDHHFRQFGG